MTTHSLALLAGLVCAAVGGEFFVRGAVGLATAARIPAGIVGATVAAFATSSPELSVAIGAGREGQSELALGDALGSNVVNVGVVLGLALLLGPMRLVGGVLRRDLVVAAAVPIVTGVLAFDGTLGSADALVLLVVFGIWIVLTVLDAARQRSSAGEVLGEASFRVAVAVGLVGLVLLVLAGRLIVSGAKGIGAELGLDPFVVGVVFVAIGTSMPELATALVARLRGHDEIGLGTVLGSNVFNGTLIVPVAALLSPMAVAWDEVAVSLLFGTALVLAVVPGRGAILGRGRGVLLLAGYAASVVVLLLTQG